MVPSLPLRRGRGAARPALFAVALLQLYAAAPNDFDAAWPPNRTSGLTQRVKAAGAIHAIRSIASYMQYKIRLMHYKQTQTQYW